MKTLKIIGLVLGIIFLVCAIFVGVEALVSLFNGMPFTEQLKWSLANFGDFFKKPFIK